MIEIYKNIYRLPLTTHKIVKNTLSVHIIKAEPRSCIIDPGIGVYEDIELIINSLKELEIDLHDLDILITHNHADHTAAVSTLCVMGATAYMYPYDAIPETHFSILFSQPGPLWRKNLYMLGAGLEVNELKIQELADLGEENAFLRPDFMIFPFTPIDIGDKFSYGDYVFEVTDARGHTPGQVGFLCHDIKLCFVGDMVMTGLTPVIMTTTLDQHVLEMYKSSLLFVINNLQGYTLLSSHGDIMTDAVGECTRLLDAYLRRCDRMFKLVEKEKRPLSAIEVTNMMYGKPLFEGKTMRYIDFMMATTKTLSCLEYLKDDERLKRKMENGVAYWYV